MHIGEVLVALPQARFQDRPTWADVLRKAVKRKWTTISEKAEQWEGCRRYGPE